MNTKLRQIVWYVKYTTLQTVEYQTVGVYLIFKTKLTLTYFRFAKRLTQKFG